MTAPTRFPPIAAELSADQKAELRELFAEAREPGPATDQEIAELDAIVRGIFGDQPRPRPRLALVGADLAPEAVPAAARTPAGFLFLDLGELDGEEEAELLAVLAELTGAPDAVVAGFAEAAREAGAADPLSAIVAAQAPDLA